MLGFVGRFGSSKGMAAMPNLSGLSREQAITQIQNAGLRFASGSFASTTKQSINNLIESQSVSAGQLVDYESDITISSYVYSPPANVIDYGPCAEYKSQLINSVCAKDTGNPNSINSCAEVYTVRKFYRQPERLNGVDTGNFAECAFQDITENGLVSSAVCCPPPAPRTCDPSSTVIVKYSEVPCVGGTQTRTVRKVYSNCDEEDVPESRCCQLTAKCGEWTSWSSGSPSTRTLSCTDTKCDPYTVTQTRCTVSCGSWQSGTCSKGSRTQTRSCIDAACGSYSESRTVVCVVAK
jgi:hypothetical protein